MNTYNPLTEQIEEISSKIIGDLTYHGKKVVLLDDATQALEELERKLSAIYQKEIERIRMIQESDYRMLL